MVGSRFDAEALSAARMADAMVRAARMTWAEVLVEPIPALFARKPLSRDEQLELCLGSEDILNAREARFIATIRRQQRPWSEKQARVVEQIVNKILDEIGGAR
jgi:hypothetical protein